MELFFGQEKIQKKQKQPGKERRKDRKRRRDKLPDPSAQSSEPKEPELVLNSMIKFINLEDEEVDCTLENFIDENFASYDKLPVVEGFIEEDDDGNIQYKLKLIKPTSERIAHLTTQMKFRINEGNGQAYYRLGVEDNGTPCGLRKQDMFQSLMTICKLAQNLKLEVVIVRAARGLHGMIIELLVRKNVGIGLSVEIKVLLLGEEGSGKSTILGVLTSGQLDDGKGKARMQVCLHKHDLLKGSTSSINQHVIGFTSEGKLLNKSGWHTSIEQIVLNSSKLITFIDISGKKTAHVITSLHSYFPEYVVWVISALNPKCLSNPLRLSNVFNVPIIVIITHADAGGEKVFDTLKVVKEKLLELSPNKIPLVVRNNTDAVLFSRTISDEEIIPIFQLSCLNGAGLDLITNFLSLLPSHNSLKTQAHQLAEFIITEKYQIKGKLILGGTVLKGSVKRGKILHLGPDNKGNFWPVQITSIECKRVAVAIVASGQTCTIGIRMLPYSEQWLSKGGVIRKGMVLVDQKLNPRATNQFVVELQHHNPQDSVEINEKYKPVINTITSRQSCKIIFPNRNAEDEGIPYLKKRSSKSIELKKRRKGRDKDEAKPKSKSKHKRSVDLQMSLDKLFVEDPGEGEVRQQVRFKEKKKKESTLVLPGDKSFQLRLRFERQCQYLHISDRVIIHDGSLQAYGTVVQLIY